jgi:F420-non-reducing hydrogenase iron-sulfur subunit
MSENGFEPKIVAFLCNWCTYVGADLAGTSRIQYPPNVRVIRLMCSGAVDQVYVLKALLDGADGVLIGGCHPGRLPLSGRELQGAPPGGGAARYPR